MVYKASTQLSHLFLCGGQDLFFFPKYPCKSLPLSLSLYRPSKLTFYAILGVDDLRERRPEKPLIKKALILTPALFTKGGWNSRPQDERERGILGNSSYKGRKKEGKKGKPKIKSHPPPSPAKNPPSPSPSRSSTHNTYVLLSFSLQVYFFLSLRCFCTSV